MSDPMRRLARLRVPLGFICAVAALWFAAPTRTTLTVGTAIALCGEALRIWAAGHLNKSREVTESGPYRVLAHPLYVGSSIMGAGLAVASRSVIVAAIVGIYLAATISAAVRSEEAFLRARFGERYDRYRQGGAASVARPFSIAQAIANREYRAISGLAGAVLLLLLKATYNGSL
jgi:protein-S-isoprenylcysteine O-methyltransferase Ste14